MATGAAQRDFRRFAGSRERARLTGPRASRARAAAWRLETSSW